MAKKTNKTGRNAKNTTVPDRPENSPDPDNADAATGTQDRPENSPDPDNAPENDPVSEYDSFFDPLFDVSDRPENSPGPDNADTARTETQREQTASEDVLKSPLLNIDPDNKFVSLTELLNEPANKKEFADLIENYTFSKMGITKDTAVIKNEATTAFFGGKFNTESPVLDKLLTDTFDDWRPEKENFQKAFREHLDDYCFRDYQVPMRNAFINTVEPRIKNQPDRFPRGSGYNYAPDRDTDPFVRFINKNIYESLDSGTSPFLYDTKNPVYTQNPFSNRVYKDANQIANLANNGRLDFPYINYAPITVIADRNWMKKMAKVEKQRAKCSICYMGKDPDGNKKYEMTVPTKGMTAVFPDTPSSQQPIAGIGMNQQFPQGFMDGQIGQGGIEQFVQTMVQNYLNAAFTKLPYYAPQWSPEHSRQLAGGLAADPNMMVRTGQNAFREATAIRIPEQDLDVNREISNNPLFKRDVLNTLVKEYFNPRAAKSSFMQYADVIADIHNSPITPENIHNRFESMLAHPAIRGDMISAYNNIVNTDRKTHRQDNAKKFPPAGARR